MVLSMDRWVGKVAVVTGASAGIGAAVTEKLVEHGVNVVGLARRQDRLEQLAKKLSSKKGKLYPLKTDMSKEEDILKAFKWIKDNLGPVHILINNAGMLKIGSYVGGDVEAWKKIFELNVIALSIATSEAVKDMKANNVDGHIIHMNSTLGHQVMNFPGGNVYPASKFAVTALAETLRLELNAAKSKIKITSLSPGAVHTEIASGSPQFAKLVEGLAKEKHILEPEDVADSVIYILSTPPHVQVQDLMIRPVVEPF